MTKENAALKIALKALRTLHTNGISDEIAGTALNDIQDVLALQTSRPDAGAARTMMKTEIAPGVSVYMTQDQIIAWRQSVDKGRWQDISTAPRDGESVLICTLNGFDENWDGCGLMPTQASYFPDWHGPGKGAWHRFGEDEDLHPTHWLPLNYLPAPPTSEGV